MSIIVTGAYGFIGANLVHRLNQRDEKQIIAVDDLSEQCQKFRYLNGAHLSDFYDKKAFLVALQDNTLKLSSQIQCIFHQGACSDTMNHDGRFMMENNYEYTKTLFHYAQEHGIPFIYASSAATYGDSQHFAEVRDNENPLNIYGYSKLLFDRYWWQWKQQNGLTAPVYGLRYFNVYGPYEAHKGKMASVAFHHFHQFQNEGVVRLFGEYDGYAAGEQQRDFVYVDDIVDVNIFLYDQAKHDKKYALEKSAYMNVGTGHAQSFNELALSTISALTGQEYSLERAIKEEKIQYINFPEALKDKYQSFTQADLSYLRQLGYDHPFLTVQEGVSKYVDFLKNKR